jgi:hypothetical protein
MPRISPDLMKAINGARQLDWLTQEDRAHLDRWMEKEEASNSIWDDLAAAIKAHGEFHYHSGPLFIVVHQAILARREVKRYSDFDTKRAKKEAERISRDLVTLANKMEEVATAYATCTPAHQRGGPPPPEVESGPWEDPVVTLRKQSLAWLQKDAQRIRDLATAKPTRPHDDIGFLWEVRVRRQKKGKKHSNSGEISIFVQDMAGLIKEATGKRFWNAVACVTNIAFPSREPLMADDVRVICKPTTRAGRRNKPVHSSVGEGKKRL